MPWVYNQPPASSRCHVFAARPVAGFASGGIMQTGWFEPETGMRTRGETSRDLRMAIKTSLVPNERSAFDSRGNDDTLLDAGTGDQKDSAGRRPKQKQQ